MGDENCCQEWLISPGVAVIGNKWENESVYFRQNIRTINKNFAWAEKIKIFNLRKKTLDKSYVADFKLARWKNNTDTVKQNNISITYFKADAIGNSPETHSFKVSYEVFHRIICNKLN